MYIFLLFYRFLVFVPSMLCLRVVGAGVVICLEQGADLHMAQLHAGCHSLSLGSVKNRVVKRVCVCACVRVCYRCWPFWQACCTALCISY